MRSRSLLMLLATALLAGCQTHPRSIMQPPPYAAPPPPPPAKAPPVWVKPAPPNFSGTAGPLSRAGVGRYMDGLEGDLRRSLHGLPVARPGDTIVVNLQDDVLFAHGELSDQGHDVLKTLGAALVHYDRTGIEVNAYTDTRGTPEENLKTSQKHADAVAAALREDGIAAKRIGATGFGREHLKVATGAGIKNPRNRRIEIRIVPKPDLRSS